MYVISQRVVTETWNMMKRSLLLAIVFLAGAINHVIVMAFIGHVGDLELAAVSLGNSILCVTSNNLFYGLLSGTDAFFSQTFGSGRNHAVGAILQRSFVLITLMTCLLSPLYLNIEFILVIFGQDADIARLAGQYVSWYIPGIYMFAVWVILSKYLSFQNQAAVTSILSCIGNTVTALSMYMFIHILHLGVWSCGIALGLCWFVIDILAIGWSLYEGSYKTHKMGWSWLALDEMMYFVKLCCNGMAVTILDWLAFDVLIIVSGTLGEVALAAQGVYFIIYKVLMCISFGMCEAVSIRVGHSLGSGEPFQAQLQVQIGIFLAVAQGVIKIVLLVGLKHIIPSVFTSSPDVIQAVASMMTVMGCMQLADAVMFVGRGANRGSGQLTMALIASVCTFILTGIPLSTYLLLGTSLGLPGGWIGMTISISACAAFYAVYYIHFVDWKALSQQALQRVDACSGESLTLQDDPNSLPACEVTEMLHSSYRRYDTYGDNDSGYDGDRMADDDKIKIRSAKIKGILMVTVAVVFITFGILGKVEIPISLVYNHVYVAYNSSMMNKTSLNV